MRFWVNIKVHGTLSKESSSGCFQIGRNTFALTIFLLVLNTNGRYMIVVTIFLLVLNTNGIYMIVVTIFLLVLNKNERNTIVVTVFLLIMNHGDTYYTYLLSSKYRLLMNPTDSRLVHIRKENCRYDRVPFNLEA